MIRTRVFGAIFDNCACALVQTISLRFRAINRELKQPGRRRQQERHKFAYLTMKNSTFARSERAFFIFGHLADVLDLSTTWNDMFCSCPDDVSMWWQMFNFVSFPLKRWFQFNSRIVWTHFASVMTLNNSEMIAEMRSYIFIRRSCCRRRLLCLNSLLSFCLPFGPCRCKYIAFAHAQFWTKVIAIIECQPVENHFRLFVSKERTFWASDLRHSESGNARKVSYGILLPWYFDPHQLVWFNKFSKEWQLSTKERDGQGTYLSV